MPPSLSMFIMATEPHAASVLPNADTISLAPSSNVRWKPYVRLRLPLSVART